MAVGRKPTRARPRPCLGDGGIYTSIDDLAKWDRALREHTLLSEAEMQPALTPVNPRAAREILTVESCQLWLRLVS